jgi:hypothetical protein
VFCFGTSGGHFALDLSGVRVMMCQTYPEEITMEAATQTAPARAPKKWMKWTGRGLSVVPVLLMSFGFVSLILQRTQVIAGMAHFGYTEDRLPLVFTLEAIAVILYVIPQTAIFGAVFMTAYFGGAVATHVRIHDPGWPLAVIAGVCAWIGLYLREERLHDLVPLRRL